MKWIWLAAVLFALTGCLKTRNEAVTLTLATTTSTRDSGLLDVLVPMFEKETGITVSVLQSADAGAMVSQARIEYAFNRNDLMLSNSRTENTNISNL